MFVWALSSIWNKTIRKITLCKKYPYLEFFGPYFPAFGLNMDRKNSEYGHFSPSVKLLILANI